MVCDRCVIVVRQQLDSLGLSYKNIQLSEAELAEPAPKDKLQTLKEQLHNIGFEVLDDKKSTIVEKIKNAIISKSSEYFTKPCTSIFICASKLLS